MNIKNMKHGCCSHSTYKKKILLAVLVAGAVSSIIFSCAGTIPSPTEIDIRRMKLRWPDTRKQDLDDGRIFYINRCSGCHSLHSPEHYTEQQWKKIFPGMAVRAHLLENESKSIFRYLLTFAKDSSYTMK